MPSQVLLMVWARVKLASVLSARRGKGGLGARVARFGMGERWPIPTSEDFLVHLSFHTILWFKSED